MALLAGAALIAGAIGPAGMPGREVRAQEVDIVKIFSCEPAVAAGISAAQCVGAREIILGNCTSCHTFVPIVKAQKSPDEWSATLAGHRDRLPDMGDDQIGEIQRYLAARFNPSNPPPELPPELEALGTGQAN